MATHARHIAILGGLLALAVVAPGTVAAASPVDARNDAPRNVVAVGPTVIDPLVQDDAIGIVGDLPGAASATRPLTISAVGRPSHGTAFTDGRTIVYDPAACYTGIDSFTYTITDGLTSDTATVIFSVGRPASGPATDVPQAGFVTGSKEGSTVPVKVTWCGAVASGASLKGYRVVQSTNGGATFWTTAIASGTTTSSTRGATVGTNYAWRVTTTDTKGASSTTSLASRVTRFQENNAAIAYSSGWRSISSRSFSGGRERYTTKSGATATLTVSGVRQYAIVAGKGPGRGSFNVYVDGVRVTSKAISERASTAAFRRVLYVGTIGGDTSARHTIRVRTTSTARVDLDAILTMSGKASQTVTFGTPAGARTYKGTPYAATAAASSGQPVLLNVARASWLVCAIDHGTVSFHGTGTCSLTATQPGDATWNARTTTQSIAVGGAPLTILGITAANRPYAPGNVSATLDTSGAFPTGFFAGDQGGVALDASGASGAFADANAGEGKPVTVTGLVLTGAKASLYAIAPPAVSATINKADQVITFSTPPAFPVRGGADYVVSATSTSGALPAITVDPTSTGVCTLTGNVVSFTGSGSCLLDATVAGGANWNPATGNQPLSVASTGTTGQAITFAQPSDATYGDPTVPLGATASSGLTVTFSSATTGVCTVSGATLTLVGAGACTVEARQAGDPTYAPAAPVDRTFQVARKSLTVTGITASDKTYDGTQVATLSTAGAALVGIVGSDDVHLTTAGATGTFHPNANAGPGKTVSVAGLGLAGAKSSSYALTQPSTTASIAKATLTVTSTDHTITYGGADPATFDFGYAGFIGGEGPGDLGTAPTCSVAGASRDVSGSPYAIGCSGGVSVNYAFSYVAGHLTVNPKPVTVSFSAANRAYTGSTVASITGCSVAIIESGDTASCSSASATASFATAGVGNAKAVTGTGFTVAGVDGGNYTITVVNATVADISKAAPSCTITPYDVPYDGNAHTATGSCLGVLGETLAAPNLAGTTHTLANAYPTDPWTFTDVTGNYLNDSGTVSDTISKAAQTITFGALSGKTYGNAPFAVSATSTSGLTVTFTSQTTTVCTVSTATVTLLKGGSCTIRASQAGDANHQAASVVDQSFTVTKATISVTADNQAFTFGGTEPAYTFTYGTFAGGDGPGGIDTPPTCDATTFNGNAGSWPITCTGGVDDQYQFTFVAGTLTVNKASQTVSFDGLAPVGATAGSSSTQTATATSGLTVTITVDATAAGICSITGGTLVHYDTAGTCVLDANQAGNANFNPAPQVQLSFPIALASQTITFNALSNHAYGASFTVSATASSGLTVTFSSQTPSVCTVATTTVTVIDTGACTIRASQAGSAAFSAAAPVDQSFTATTRPITVTAAADTKVADGTTASSGTPTVTAGGPLATGDTGSFTQTFDTAAAGTRTLTPTGLVLHGATDVTTRYAITWTTASGRIDPAPAATLDVTAPSPQTAGNAFTVTVTARDPYGNVATGYRGFVGLTTSDANHALPSEHHFIGSENGVHAFAGVTLRTAGTQTVTATDTVTSSITGLVSITVNPAALASIVISPSTATITTDDSQAYTAEGFDTFGNSRGDVTSTTAFGIVPGAGSCTLASCTATAPGAYTVTGSKGGFTDGAALTVNPGAAATLQVTAGSPQVAGAPFPVTVTALDAHGNTATGYTGTVTLASTPSTTMPPDHTFTVGNAGVFAFDVTIAVAGPVTFTATDTGAPTVTGTSSAIQVQ